MADQWEQAASDWKAKNGGANVAPASVTPSATADDPWAKAAAEYSKSDPGRPQILATPKPTGMFGRAEQFLSDAAEDVRHGTTLTPIGTALHAMGAQGTSMGNSEKVGDFMASPMLGTLRAATGATQIPQGKLIEGGKNLVGGAMDAATIPGAMSLGPDINAAMDVAPGLVKATGRAIAGGGRAAADQIRPLLSGFNLKKPLKSIPELYDALANTYRGARQGLSDYAAEQRVGKSLNNPAWRNIEPSAPVSAVAEGPLPKPQLPSGRTLGPALQAPPTIRTRTPAWADLPKTVEPSAPVPSPMETPSLPSGRKVGSIANQKPITESASPPTEMPETGIRWDPSRGHVDLRTGKAPVSSVEVPVTDAQRLVDTLGNPNQFYGKYAMRPNSAAQIERNAAALRDAAARRENSRGAAELGMLSLVPGLTGGALRYMPVRSLQSPSGRSPLNQNEVPAAAPSLNPPGAWDRFSRTLQRLRP